jgi:TRAP-type mannitol/chloroaromatic compound transport system permease small subunit
MRLIKSLTVFVNRLNDFIGKIVSLLIFLMIFVLLWEVISRYVLNRPTIWAHELSTMAYAAFFLLGGAYALRQGAHVNVEIIYQKFPTRLRAAVDLLNWTFFYLFIGLLFWNGFGYAWTATMRMEHASTVWGPPIWPVKWCIPMGAFLLLLQGVTKTLGDFTALVTGRSSVPDHVGSKETGG